MKLVSFLGRDTDREAAPRLGVMSADLSVADVSAVLPSLTMGRLVGDAQALADLAKVLSSLPRLAHGTYRLCAPLRPNKNIICVGKNYRKHAIEFQSSGFDSSSGGQSIPEHPAVFTKPVTTIIADADPIPASADDTNSVDYEGELVVVIGKKGRAIAAERALDYVFGYTLLNDVTARVTQGLHKQWFLGKSLDGFGPLGPAIVTADEIPDPTKLRLRTKVNGELRQDASVADLIFDIPFLIACISKIMTLDPGDMIATGTPEGVGIGFSPPRYLRAGDRVEISVSEIGTLTNPVT
jgi:2-keto-4-pentenoate hydratase/2-oxohepta-3-ene-1,7-dioic acid hydratase in catechol pathway